MTFTTTALVAAWAAIALLSFAVAGLLRQVNALRTGGGWIEPDFGPERDAPAPPLTAELPPPAPALLLFADEDCEGCAEVLPVFSSLASNGMGGARRFVAVFKNGVGANGLDSAVLTVTEAGDAFRKYRVPVTPFAVAIGSDGTILASAAVGATELLEGFALDTKEAV